MKKVYEQVYPAIVKWTVGEPEKLTPQMLLGDDSRAEQLKKNKAAKLPFESENIEAELRQGGILLTLPMATDEDIYGLGLQLHSFIQNGKRKVTRANADPVADTGDTHAPVPFYVSSRGYGVLVDSARNVQFDFGSAALVKNDNRTNDTKVGTNTEELYRDEVRDKRVRIFIQGIQGVTLYLFAGASMKETVEQYNLFSGGGCLPPIWGLGNLYRCYTKAIQQDVEKIMDKMKRDKMPFSMLGLEPGWHTHAYSCSFRFDEGRYPNSEDLIREAADRNIHMNLWEQAYVHPMAEEDYTELQPYAGDYEVWGGLVPDFATEGGKAVYGRIQKRLIEMGVDAVKLDECDGSDYSGGWFFPQYTNFPSELCGESAKNMFGAMAMRCVQDSFQQLGRQTYSQIRANYSYGAPMPFVLYSDLYDHREFIRGVCNMGFSGLLWSPEVRQCETEEELIRRLQAVIFSPLSLINAWMIPNPPWEQFDINKNLNGERLVDDSLKEKTRELLEWRNRLIPYLYQAFYQYHQKGTPPFRALVLDYPMDIKLRAADDCYMMGESLLVAPILAGKSERSLWLPEGIWYDFWNGSRYEGGAEYTLYTEQIPVFVRENSIIPIALQTEAPSENMIFQLELRCYGYNYRELLLPQIEASGKAEPYRITRGADGLNIPSMKEYQIARIVEIQG